MPTITGQRLSQLSTLSLGSTGTLFYVESAGGNSFKMSESGLYRTLYQLQLSGAFQQKNEDWRFIHTTGNEFITGLKSFVNTLRGPGLINYTGGNTSISLFDVNNPSLTYGGNNIVYWGVNKLLIDSLTNTSVDWDNRILSGNWNAADFRISGKRVLRNGDILTDSANTQSIDYGNRLLKNVLGNTTINWDGHTIYDSDTNKAINWDDRKLFNTLSQASVDWENGILSGDWTVSGTQITVNDLMANGTINGDGIILNTLSSTAPSNTTLINLVTQQISDINENVTIDWSGRILSGDWHTQGLRLVLTGTAPSTPTSFGISGQVALSGSRLYVATGSSKWGYINITPW